jgi:hypothetical protein
MQSGGGIYLRDWREPKIPFRVDTFTPFPRECEREKDRLPLDRIGQKMLLCHKKMFSDEIALPEIFC